jgi:hypothetical protein
MTTVQRVVDFIHYEYQELEACLVDRLVPGGYPDGLDELSTKEKVQVFETLGAIIPNLSDVWEEEIKSIVKEQNEKELLGETDE